jgi:transketolase
MVQNSYKKIKKAFGLPDEKFYISSKTKEFLNPDNVSGKMNVMNGKMFFLCRRKKILTSQNNYLKEKHPNIQSNLISLSARKRKNLYKQASGEILKIISKEDKFIKLGNAELFCSNGNYIKEGGYFSDQNPVYRN